MANDVEIRVKVRNDTRPGFAEARRDAATEGAAAGRAFGDGVERGAKQGVTGFTRDAAGRLRDARGKFVREGTAAGQGFGQGIGAGATVARTALSSIMGAASAASGALRAGGAGGAMLAGGLLLAAGTAQKLLGLLLTLPGVIGGVAAAASTLLVALSGVGAALGAMGSSSGGAAKAGRNMASQARQIRNAARQIEEAQRGVARAERSLADAHRAVEDASRSYQRALVAQERAERDIARARDDAIRDLEDLAEAQSDAVLDVAGAELALKRAQENLLRTNADRRASDLDRQEAAHDLLQAEERLSDAKRDAQRAEEDNTEAQRKGIEGSDAVVAAREAYADAQAGVADAARGVEDAQRGVADAELALEDAHRAVADAQQNYQDVLDQQKEAAVGAAGGVDAYAEALRKLSPNARAFVETIRALLPQWQELQRSVQDRFFAGLADDVQALAQTYFPVLREEMGAVAGAMNAMIRDLAQDLLDPATVEDVRTIFDNVTLALENARPALGDFVTGFLQLAAVGSEYLPEIGTWIKDIAADFKEWTSDPEAIKKMIDEGITAFKDLYAIGKDIWAVITGIVNGLAGDGEGTSGFLANLKEMTATWNAFVNNPATQFFLGLIGMFVDSIWEVIGSVTVLDEIWNIFRALIALTMVDFSGLTGMWDGFVNACAAGLDWVQARWQQWWGWITGLAGQVGAALSNMWSGLGGAARNAANMAIGALNSLIGSINFVIRGLNSINPFGAIPQLGMLPKFASGGIGSGLALVGEQGRELVQLPSGSRVLPHGDTERQLAGMGGGSSGGGSMEIRVAPGSDGAVADMIMKLIRAGKIQIKAA